jgi:hypothetical protein
MLYQLPNGKTIEMSTEKYLDMSDDELKYLEAYNQGDSIDNPFFGSTLEKVPLSQLDDEDLEDLMESQILDIGEITSLEKLHDIDIEGSYFEE